MVYDESSSIRKKRVKLTNRVVNVSIPGVYGGKEFDRNMLRGFFGLSLI
jgi:hypothetical protein